MKITPSKKQWSSWSMPSKYTAIGLLIAVFMFLIWVFSVIFPSTNYPKLNHELLLELSSKDISSEEIHNLFYELSIEHEEQIDSKTWNEYAEAILSIYNQLAPNSIIQINDSIEGLITKKKRKIDLCVKQKVAGQEVMVAFKLHPWDFELTNSELLQFKLLLKDINASKGVIITNSNIDSTLINFATENIISICSLTDTDSKDWNTEITIPVIWVEVIPQFYVSYTFSLNAMDKMHRDIQKVIFSYDNGVNTFMLLDYLNHKWANLEFPHITDSLHISYLETKNLKVKVNQNDWRLVKKFIVHYTSLENCWIRYFTPEKYKAIKNHITNEIDFVELKLGVSIPDNSDKKMWQQIRKVDVDSLKGLNILVTTDYQVLKEEDLKTNNLFIRKVD